MHFPAAHHLRRFNCGGRGFKGGFNAYHHPLAQPRGRAKPHTGDFENSLFIALAYYGANLCRPDIEADD
jgi:hypothetical protein